MRFLGFTGLQAALLTLITAGAIVVLYLLKHRRRRFVVSSTQLWKRVLENHLENSLFEKLRRYFSILLAVVTALLVALAIARPEVAFLSGKAQQTVLVLDTSPTMQTRRSDGKTRWQHAVDAAQALVDGGSGSAEFRIADTSGQFDSPFTRNKTELHRLIDRMHPVVAPSRFPEVDTPAADSESKVTFITDGVSPVRLPKDATSISVYENAPNAGITAFEIRSMPTAPLAYEAFLEIYNSGKDSRSVEITVSGAGQQRIMKSVKVSDVTGSLSEYAREGLQEPIVVTRKGKPVMAVMPLTKYDDWESVLLSTNPKFMAIIERSRANAQARRPLSLEEVRLKYGLPAKAARRRPAR